MYFECWGGPNNIQGFSGHCTYSSFQVPKYCTFWAVALRLNCIIWEKGANVRGKRGYFTFLIGVNIHQKLLFSVINFLKNET